MFYKFSQVLIYTAVIVSTYAMQLPTCSKGAQANPGKTTQLLCTSASAGIAQKKRKVISQDNDDGFPVLAYRLHQPAFIQHNSLQHKQTNQHHWLKLKSGIELLI